MAKRRLDTLLAARGLYESRTRAAAAVLAGDVRLTSGGERTLKPGQMVGEDVSVEVATPPPFVSRGGVKLANALDAFGLDPAEKRCLDAGASTGGFTDCLLQRGADEVVAVDVSYGEFHWRLRKDARVTLLERTNVRDLDCRELPFAPDLVVADLSFISLGKVLPGLLRCAAERFDCLAMVKPQFELGPDRVPRGGVVREASDRREALVAVGQTARTELGLSVLGYASSGLPGPAGNRESFAWIAEPGREGDRSDLDAAAREVEP